MSSKHVNWVGRDMMTGAARGGRGGPFGDIHDGLMVLRA